MIYGAIDVEIHAGSDGRYYVLDLARTLPPDPRRSKEDLILEQHGKYKSNKKKSSHLFELFRSELIYSYSASLCCNAFTSSCKSPKVCKTNLIALKDRLINSIIPLAASAYDCFCDGDFQFPVSCFIHAFGINVRYLGKFFTLLKSKRTKKLVEKEMVSRSLKVFWRKHLRRVSFEVGSLSPVSLCS